jgi:hypothetical protein
MAVTYTPAGTYNDRGLSPADKALVEKYQNDWAVANASGDEAGKAAAHSAAESVRATYNYSGGGDGSQYIGSLGSGVYVPAKLQAASTAEDYINAMYARQQEANLQALKSAYDQNVNTLGAAEEKIPLQYEAARNSSAGDAEVQKAAFNEYAAAQGINSGAGSQARLSFDNALSGDLARIYASEANAKADIALQRAQLETKYKNDVAGAIASGNLEKGKALYGDYVRVDNSLANVSQAQAGENYRAWSASDDLARYSDAQAKSAAETARIEQQTKTARENQLLAQAVSLVGKGFSQEQIVRFIRDIISA